MKDVIPTAVECEHCGEYTMFGVVVPQDGQSLVRAFHKTMGATTGPNRPSSVAYRAKFVSEEANELETAMQYDDLVATIDALCDLLYVVYGTAVSLGLDLDPFFAEVHRSNMTKTPNGNGKAIKGPNYSPPDLTRVLANTDVRRPL